MSERPPNGGRFNIGVLVSGSGTNLQAILDTVHGRDGIEVVAVASNRTGAKALERARDTGVGAEAFELSSYPNRAARDTEMASWLQSRGVELVVLAGYMELVEPAFLAGFPKRVINVHPSLLPAFPGPTPIEDQIAYGVKVGGVTVHFVDEGVDSGPVVLQQAMQLPYTRDPEEILNLLHGIEHELLPRAIRLIAAGAVSFDADNSRYVHVDEQAMSARG
ncbi:MAG: phosphoribosylglycinamide formyltransferase [Solirubrobacterales bacterium]